jgi:hypothetical protein
LELDITHIGGILTLGMPHGMVDDMAEQLQMVK